MNKICALIKEIHLKEGEFVSVNVRQSINCELQERDRRLISTLKKIVLRGNNAEVRGNCDGSWVVYEVKKKKEVVG